MELPYGTQIMTEAHKQVVRSNKLESRHIRPIAFYGAGKIGVPPKGIRAKTASFGRHHVNVTMARAQFAATYANSILANAKVIDQGCDEGLLRDVDGFVAGGAGENIFIIKDGVLYAPELTPALAGITCGSIVALVADPGYQVVSRRIARDDVSIADEAFFTGTAAQVTPIRELDGCQIVTGKGKKHNDWIAPVGKLGKLDKAAGPAKDKRK